MTDMLAGGVWSDLATPFLGSTHSVDDSGLFSLIEQANDAAVSGLVVFGDLSESEHLDRTEREVVLETVVDSTDLPLIVDCPSRATAAAVDLALAAADIAGDRMIAVIAHVDSADRPYLMAHLNRLREAAGVGVVVQDWNRAPTAARALVAALEELPFVCGIKVAAQPASLTIAELARLTEIPIFGSSAGLHLADELLAGAAGTMTGTAFPEILVECVRRWTEGDHEGARATLQPYLPLAAFEQHSGPALAVRKETLRRRGLIAEASVRPPAPTLPELSAPLLNVHIDNLIGRS